MRENKPLFELGRVVCTPGADALIKKEPDALDVILRRHQGGDWGDVCPDDKQVNDEALKAGDRLLSAYKMAGEKVWIITERDRSFTTVLLPDEY